MTWLTEMLEGAPVLAALAIAFILGLRQAADPDHRVAVTSLVAADDGEPRRAARLGSGPLGRLNQRVAPGWVASPLAIPLGDARPAIG